MRDRVDITAARRDHELRDGIYDRSSAISSGHSLLNYASALRLRRDATRRMKRFARKVLFAFLALVALVAIAVATRLGTRWRCGPMSSGWA